MSGDSDALEANLGGGLALAITPLDDGLRVTVYEGENDGDDVVYSSEHTRDFFTSSQKVRTIANAVERGTPDAVDGEAVAQSFRDFCSALNANSDEVEAQVRPPTVRRLLDETERVTRRDAGDTCTYTVTFDVGGETADVDFTLSEWAHGGAKTLKERYLKEFFTRLDTDTVDDAWEALTEAWDARLEVVEGDDTDPITVLSEAVLDELRGDRCEAFDSADALSRSRRAAFYEADTSARTSVDTDGPVVWVRAQTFADAVRGAGGTNGDVADVANALADEGVVYGGDGSLKTRLGTDGRHPVYPLDPDAIGVTAPTDTDLLDGDEAGYEL